MNTMRFIQELDQSARLFYQEMALRTENTGIRRIFEMLSEDEESLLERHRTLVAQGETIDAKTLDRAINIFEQLRRSEEQLEVKDDVAAYRLALDTERDVLQQYRDAAKAEKHPDVKKLLTKIVQDEKRHVLELEALYDFANAPNHYLAWGEFSNRGDFQNFGRDIV